MVTASSTHHCGRWGVVGRCHLRNWWIAKKKKKSLLLLSCCCFTTEGIQYSVPKAAASLRTNPPLPGLRTAHFLQSLFASFCAYFIRSLSVTSLSERRRMKRGFVGFSKTAGRFLTGRRMEEVCGHTCSCRPTCIITVKPDEESVGGRWEGAKRQSLRRLPSSHSQHVWVDILTTVLILSDLTGK